MPASKVASSGLSPTCGVEGGSLLTPFIVGGQEATPHSFPWMAALVIDSAWFCSGSLISSSHILTAAHCVEGASYYDILLGGHNISASREAGRLEVTSYRAITHPHWNPVTLAGDLAIIELPSAVVFSPSIRPICLPAPGSALVPKDPVWMAGWGRFSDSVTSVSPLLR